MTDLNNHDDTPSDSVGLLIEMMPNGGLRVEGNCLDNPILAYGLLEAAKDSIRNSYRERQRGPRIELASGLLPGRES